MARKVRITFLYVVVSLVFFASLYHHYLRYSIPFAANPPDIHLRPISTASTTTNSTASSSTTPHDVITATTATSATPHDVTNGNLTIITDHEDNKNKSNTTKKKNKERGPEGIPVSPFSTVSVLMPDWELLVLVSPEDTPSMLKSLPGHEDDFVCVHYTKEVTQARPSSRLPLPDRMTFRCLLPDRARKRLPFKQPALVRLPAESPEEFMPPPLLLLFSNIVYDSLTEGEDDVVLFVKGVIKKQDIVREPSEFRCVFGDDAANAVRTAVKTSTLEVFRCQRPKLTDVTDPASSSHGGIKVSLEILTEKRVVPSVAYYTPTPPRKLAAVATGKAEKSLLCACTMVYNVAKFLKEWVYYHSKIGVQKFVLYDNGSDDGLEKVVSELNEEGYDVHTYFWLWPKTQEAGFSHSALYAKDSCTWMMYVDVDEFVYSPKWSNSSKPSVSMLQSLLPKPGDEKLRGKHNPMFSSSEDLSMTTSVKLALPGLPVGQLSMGCHEFGPSNQTTNPLMGVTQGYNCRMVAPNRHKSIVLLEAVDDSLYNVIHHFKLKSGYRSIILSIRRMMVNHYKYQAWPEFKAKFRRRVSAYVVDWNLPVNLNSQDRPRGLGATAVEPLNWTTSYCEVTDNRLRDLTRKWFRVESPTGHRMPWMM